MLAPQAERTCDSFTAEQATEPKYAVHFRVVFKYFGRLCLVLAVLTMVPLVMSLIFGERTITLRYAVVVCGLAGLRLGTARLRAPFSVQANDGIVLVALMFLFTPLAMCYPMMSSGLSFLDALFEAISGVTTTGLSTKDTLVGALQKHWQPKPEQEEPADSASKKNK